MKRTLILLLVMVCFGAFETRADIDSETRDAWYEITDEGLTGDEAGILWCVFNYKSSDPAGQPITLSAFLRIGSDWTKEGSNPTDLDNIVLMQHYTITKDADRPTYKYKSNINNNFGGNHLVIVPDHLGFGVTADQHQAYLNHHLCAQNAYDALKAGYRIFCDKASVNLRPGWRLFVAGASQGAGNAVALHRYLEEHELDEDWRLAYSFCCDGPYDPVQTLRTYQEWGGTIYPVVMPLIVNAMRDAYPTLEAYDESEIYTEAYMLIKEEIEEMIDSKNSAADHINKKILNALCPGDTRMPIETMINAELLDENTTIGNTFLGCLDDNNLLKDWTPRHQIKTYYSTNDDIVPYSNTENMLNAFGDMVIPVESHNLGHTTTCIEWFLYAMLDFPYEENPTIEAIETVAPTDKVIFDLQSRVVKRMIPGNVYIVNGQRIIYSELK